MNTRTFGKTGLNVSEIGLGCWQLGGGDWGDLDEAKAFEILQTAVDGGINFFDTADVYGGGRSEELIGKFLKKQGLGKKVFVATKLGRMGDLYPDKYTEAGVRKATEASLKRLGVERIDLTQLHCVPLEVLQQGDIFEWLRKLHAEGKIGAFGASIETVSEGLFCIKQQGLASLQIIFNLFRQKPNEELIGAAHAAGVAIIVRLPLASGLLGGRLNKATVFPANDHRNYNRDGQAFNVGETFAGLPFEKGVELVENLGSMVPSGLTLPEMAQRWILDHEGVTTVITGASRPAQVTSNVKVSSIDPLSEELHCELEDFYQDQVAAHIRGPY
jgi:aryl-alcohol dehydrogenase-like predicted oxidoreductase